MKHFLTASAMLCSFLAAAQFPNLPYNPDENGDGLIGVVDLQGLLANYGNEFSSAVLSEDGESAITYMGEMPYPLCAQACRNLPGMWQMPQLQELGLVWDEVQPTGGNANVRTWLRGVWSSEEYNPPYYKATTYSNGDINVSSVVEGIVASSYRCYCAARQLPRVEYSYCYSQGLGGLEICSNSKTSEGWYPMGGAATSTNSGSTGSTHFIQAFWRWAE